MNQRTSLISGGLRRPNWINRLCNQVAVFEEAETRSPNGEVGETRSG